MIAQASSVASERLFSATRRVCTANRNELLPNNAERLIRIMRNNTFVMGNELVNSLVEEVLCLGLEQTKGSQ